MDRTAWETPAGRPEESGVTGDARDRDAPRGPGDVRRRCAAQIVGIGTALPRHRVTQAVAADVVVGLAGLTGAGAAWARRTFENAGVSVRHTVLADLAAGRLPFGGVARPGTATRMAAYREHAAPLAEQAARRALGVARMAAAEVTHVVLVSCTGYQAPGVDVELVRRLGLRADVDRTVVGFMGCHGGFAGLRVARKAVLAEPDAKVLLVCVELCSLHLRADAAAGSVVAHALFGDGAAAAVVTGAGCRREAWFALGSASSQVGPGTEEKMAWEIGDDGFEMTLAGDLPRTIAGLLPAFVAGIASFGEVDSWCIHPGGPAILAAARESLGIPEDRLAVSRAVLRDPGNVSSATILFVLARTAAEMAVGAGGVALGFGPGLTIEGFAFTRGPADVAAAADVHAGAGAIV